MLLKLVSFYYAIIGIILYLLFLITNIADINFFYIHLVSFITFVIYGSVILCITKLNNRFCTIRNLFLIVLLGSLYEVVLYKLLSYYIDGDLFLFSKADALRYFNDSIIISNFNIIESMNYILKSYGFDDLGVFLWFSTVFRVSPSLIFLGGVSCLVGSASALMLFDIGRNFMPRRYAFIAALSFSLASFITPYHAQCLKEPIMICIIIAAFDCFITYTRIKNGKYLVSALLFASLVLLFRVPTALLLLFSFGLTWTLLKVRGTTAIVLGLFFMLAICTTPFFSYSYDRYLKGGDAEAIMERKNKMAGEGGIINQMADPVAAIVGPFPSVRIKTVKPTPLYASGLLYRLFLSAPFLLGSFFIIKRKYIQMYPLVLFFIMSALGVAISVKGLEVRLTIPHLAAAYIVAFWFIAKCDYGQFSWRISSKLLRIYFVGIAVLCLLWNFR